MKKAYETDVNINLDEYQKLSKINPYSKLRKKTNIIGLIFVIFLTIINLFDSSNSLIIILFCDFFLIFLFVMIPIIFNDKIIEKRFNKLKKINAIDLTYKLSFYDDSIEMAGQHSNLKVKYKDIQKIIETNDNFYLFINQYQVIVVQKLNCSENLSLFIRKINDKIYQNKVNNNKSFKSKNIIKIILLILFILNIISIYLGIFTWQYIVKEKNIPLFLSYRYLFTFWIWLPFPILSIILGNKYKKIVKCKKNIISGWIVLIIFILLGLIGVLNITNEVAYEEIFKYENIIDVDIPNKGIYVRDDITVDNEKLIKNYVKFKNKNEILKFENSLKKSENWNLKQNINSTLRILIPNDMVCELGSECYYLIYIEEVDKYNTLPDEKGSYHVYTMMYNFKTTSLQIDDYIYKYR